MRLPRRNKRAPATSEPAVTGHAAGPGRPAAQVAAKHSPVAPNATLPQVTARIGAPGTVAEGIWGAPFRRHGHRMHERKTSMTWEPPYGIEP
jgi:hypothetical protein